MKEHGNVRVISLCFDESEETALKTLRTYLNTSPVWPILEKKYGLSRTEKTDPLAELLDALHQKAQVPMDTAETKQAVVKTLEALGLDRQSLQAANKPFETAFGQSAVLHLVPEELRDNLHDALGTGRSLPFMLVVDPKGAVRAKGRLEEEGVISLVRELASGHIPG